MIRSLFLILTLTSATLGAWMGSASKLHSENLPLVVIDPGHGGADLGAIGVNGVFEKDIVLDFAKSLKKQLEKRGTVRVLLTRDRDISTPIRLPQLPIFVALRSIRVMIARPTRKPPGWRRPKTDPISDWQPPRAKSTHQSTIFSVI
jgi:hypothetical protein